MEPLPHRYPAALDFLDMQELEEQTGHPVRSEYRKPGNTASGRSLPKADAIIVAPATYNTINKWANGISDNFALGILAEAVGLHIPVVVLPSLTVRSPHTLHSGAVWHYCATPGSM